MFNHERLRCYEMAKDVAKMMPGFVATWPRGTAYLDDQLKRALSSVMLNIAEGNGRQGCADRARFFCFARASASEVAACLDVASSFGYMKESDAMMLKGYLLQIVKILYKLT